MSDRHHRPVLRWECVVGLSHVGVAQLVCYGGGVMGTDDTASNATKVWSSSAIQRENGGKVRWRDQPTESSTRWTRKGAVLADSALGRPAEVRANVRLDLWKASEHGVVQGELSDKAKMRQNGA